MPAVADDITNPQLLELIARGDEQAFTKLLQRIAAEDDGAFTALFHKYMPQVYKRALRLTRSEFAAEEVVQEVFEAIWVQKLSLPVIASFEPYLFAITRNISIKYLQKIQREKAVVYQWGSHIATTDDADPVLQHDYNRQLHQALSRLPYRRRVVYDMHLQGFRHQEIADFMGISKFTVKAHLAAAGRSVKDFFRTVTEWLAPVLVLWRHSF